MRRQRIGVGETGQEDDRPPLASDRVGNRRDMLAAQVDVEQGQVEGNLGNQLERRTQVAGNTDDIAADAREKVLETICDGEIVLDDDEAWVQGLLREHGPFSPRSFAAEEKDDGTRPHESEGGEHHSDGPVERSRKSVHLRQKNGAHRDPTDGPDDTAGTLNCLPDWN